MPSPFNSLERACPHRLVGVVVGAGLTLAASPEELPVGGGSLPVAPESGKGVGMDRIDQASESDLVGHRGGAIRQSHLPAASSAAWAAVKSLPG